MSLILGPWSEMNPDNDARTYESGLSVRPGRGEAAGVGLADRYEAAGNDIHSPAQDDIRPCRQISAGVE